MRSFVFSLISYKNLTFSISQKHPLVFKVTNLQTVVYVLKSKGNYLIIFLVQYLFYNQECRTFGANYITEVYD